MTNYTKGRSLEYRAIRILEKDGWTCMRSAGSKGLWDIFAYWPGKAAEVDVRLIQVKKRKPTGKELSKLEDVMVPYKLQKELWIFEKRKRKPEIIIL